MSSLDLGRAKERAQTTFAGNVVSTPLPQRSPTADTQETGWDRAWYYLAKYTGEEFTARLVGNLLSDHPRYDWGTSSTGIHDQATFTNLFRDLGAEAKQEDLLHALDPDRFSQVGVTSAVLGTAAAIANPLDLLNKVKILKLSSKGLAFRSVAALRNNNLLKVGKGGKAIVDRAKLQEGIDRLQNALGRATDRSTKRDISRQIAAKERTIRDIPRLNKVLAQARESGVAVEDIKLADSVFEQARQGQLKTIGFSSPFALDQFSLFGTSRGIFSGDPSIALPSKLDHALLAGVGKPIKGAASGVVEVSRAALRKVGYQTLDTEFKKRLARQLSGIQQRLQGQEFSEIRDEMTALLDEGVNKFGLNRDQIEELFDIKENPFIQKPLDDAESNFIKSVVNEHFPKSQFIPARRVTLDNIDEDLESVPGGVTQGGTLHLRVSGINRSDAQRATQLWSESQAPKLGVGRTGHQSLLAEWYHVLRPSHPNAFDDVDFKALSKIEGVATYEKVGEGDDLLLVARRRGNSGRMITPDNEHQGGIAFEPIHAHNLEVVAAQLAKKKLTLSTIRPSDLLLTQDGLLDIINPEVIQPASSVKAAREQSMSTLEAFYGSPGASFIEPSHQFLYLKTNAGTTRGAKKALEEFRVKRIYRAPKNLAGKEDKFASVFDLLDQGINAGLHRAYAIGHADGLEPVQMAQVLGDQSHTMDNIAAWRRRIQDQRTAGKNPELPPVEISQDPNGSLYIAGPHESGRDILAAAAMEGVWVVPVRSTDFTGQVIDFSNTAPGPAFAFRELFRAGKDQASRGLAEDIQRKGVVADQYKLTSETGERVMLTKEAFAPSNDLMQRLGRWVGRGPVAQTDRSGALSSLMVSAEGSRELAELRFAEMVAESQNYQEFLNQLGNQFPNFDLSRVSKPELRSDVSELFETQVRPAANSHLDTLAERGVFTPTTIQQPRRLALFPGVMEHFDEGTSTINYISAQRTAEQLVAYARESMSARVPIADIAPWAKVAIRGSDEAIDVRVGDLVQRQHPQVASNVRFPKKIILPKAKREELEKAGIYANKIPDIDPATGRVHQQLPSRAGKLPQWQRPIYSFFAAESGDVLVGTRAEVSSPQALVRSVFGEGFVPAGEWGQVHAEGVFLANLLGTNINKLGKGEVRQIESRLRFLANKFLDLGLAKDTRFHVRVPWQLNHWEEIYGKFRTLAEVADSNFKLKVPKRFINMDLDVLVEAEHFAFRLEKRRPVHQGQKRLFEFIENLSDELLKRDILAGLDVKFHTGFMHRVLDPQGGAKAVRFLKEQDRAIQAMDQAFEAVVKDSPLMVQNMEGFLKGRTFHDFTTREINEFIRQVRQLKQKGATPENIMRQMLDKVKSEQAVETFDVIATAMERAEVPVEARFFSQDAVWSSLERARQSGQARFRAEAIDRLAEHGAVWEGTAAEHAALLKAGRAMNPIQAKIDRLNAEHLSLDAEIARLEKEPAAAGVSNDIERIQARVQEIERERGKLRVDMDTKMSKLFEKHGPMGAEVDVQSGVGYVRGETARRLIDQGLLKETDLMGPVDQALIRVPINKIINKVGPKDQIILMTKEAEPLLERYFQSTRRGDGLVDQFLEGYDKVLSVWKQWTLFPVPNYHVRNVMSSFYMAWLAGVTDIESYSTAIKTLSLMRKRASGAMPYEEALQALNETSVTSRQGVTIPLRDLWNKFIENGGGGLHYSEFGQAVNSDAWQPFVKKAEAAGLEPSSHMASSLFLNNKLLRGGRSIANSIESRFRLAAFYDTWKKTGDFEQAGLQMKAAFYDYSDLNMFERNVLKRVLPFYSWSRFNIPRMIQTLATEPAKHYRFARFASDVQSGALEGVPADKTGLPDWVKDHYGLVVAKTGKGHYVVRTLDYTIPVYDVFRFFDNPYSVVSEGITPFLKVPYEQLSNISTFRDRPLERVPGQPASSFTLSNLGFSRRASTQGPLGILNTVLNEHNFRSFFRPGNEVVKFFDALMDNRTYREEKPSLTTALLDAAFGRMYHIDPQMTRMLVYQDWAKTSKRWQTLIQSAERAGDDASAQALRAMFYRQELDKPPGVK